MREAAPVAPNPKQTRREDILAAAIKSVVRDGYNRTTMSHVARLAGVTRPLVQYYFPTRELLLRAAIRRILDDWRERYFSLSNPEEESKDILSGIIRLWNHMHLPEYQAYYELDISSRTDPELRRIIDELSADDAHMRYDEAAIKFSTFSVADKAAFTEARAFTTIFLEGLLRHRFGSPAEDSTQERQLALLSSLLRDYWSERGVQASSDPVSMPSAEPKLNRLRQAAEELIECLNELSKSAGPH
ncbi:TetR/AcrR family transcriptional regulator [Novosphingobium tardum]|uniref:TetR/AcrR family transcriptional regulator n=1 Tax=Novosphingobium tardum TaxID=1538021 RepID=A0ABV8RSU5_9SPHN